MDGYLFNKDLIFFNPGIPGPLFVYPANRYITVQQLLKAQEYLVRETKTSVIYIKDRRTRSRQWDDIPQDFLSRVGRVYR